MTLDLPLIVDNRSLILFYLDQVIDRHQKDIKVANHRTVIVHIEPEDSIINFRDIKLKIFIIEHILIFFFDPVIDCVRESALMKSAVEFLLLFV